MLSKRNKQEDQTFKDPHNFRIFGNPILRRDVYSVILIAFILILLLATSTYFYLDSLPEKPSSSAEFEGINRQIPAYPANQGIDRIQVLASVEEILQFHLEKTNMDQVRSYLVNGFFTSGAMRMSLRMKAKEPRKYLLQLEAMDTWVTFGYNGKELWLNESDPVVDKSTKALNEILMHLECSIPSLAWSYQNREFSDLPDRLEDANWGGRAYFVLRDNDSFQYPVIHYIDKESGLETHRSIEFEIGGESGIAEVRYYEPIEGTDIAFPSGFELSLNHRTIGTAQFRETNFNEGLLSVIFDPPAEVVGSEKTD